MPLGTGHFALRYRLPEPESGDLLLRLRVLVYILLVFLLLSVLQEPNPVHDLFGDQRRGSHAVPRDRFASPQDHAQAWAAALVLMGLVLVLGVAARWALRSRHGAAR